MTYLLIIAAFSVYMSFPMVQFAGRDVSFRFGDEQFYLDEVWLFV